MRKPSRSSWHTPSSATAAVVQARDGDEALRQFDGHSIDLVVLDLMLPKLDGLEVCKRLRAVSHVPIIMLTARDDEVDKVLGLELGADDYITKPFSIREFRSRVKAALRRAAAPKHDGDEVETISIDGLVVDPCALVLWGEREPVELTYVEFELLATLASKPGEVHSRQALLVALWGDSRTETRGRSTSTCAISARSSSRRRASPSSS